MYGNIKRIIAVIIGIISLLLVCIIFIIYSMNEFALEHYEYGFLWDIFITFFVVLFIAIPILVSKTRKIYPVVIYFLSIFVFIFVCRYESIYISNKYIHFSESTWENNIAARKIMYEDLKNDKEFLSYSKEQVIEKLGAPYLNKGDTIYYETIPGNIRIKFDKNSVEYIDYLDW